MKQIANSISLKGGLVLTAIAAAALCPACSKIPDVSPQEPPAQSVVGSPSISISGSGFILYPASCGYPCSFSFSVSSEDDNLAVSASSTDSLEVLLTLSEDRRSGTARVRAIGGLPAGGNAVMLTASNDGGTSSARVDLTPAEITIDREDFSCKAAGSSIAVSAFSNVGMSVSTSPEVAGWLHAEGRDGYITIAVDRNPSFETRGGEVVVSDSLGLIRRTIRVTQQAATDFLAREKAALVALWEATGGVDWKSLSNSTGGKMYSTDNWCTDCPIETWYGVTLNPDGHVIYLHLSGVGLKGSLPEEIGGLAYLQELWLGGNDLSGTLPKSIGNLKVLKDIDLSGMSLTGNLEDSTLSDIAPHLKSLSLSGDLFTGGFPEWVSDMPEDANFWLQGNCLEGKVPDRVKAHPRWNAEAMDGTGRTIGEINMEQREGFTLD